MGDYVKNIDEPDEVRTMPGGSGSARIVHVGGEVLMSGELQPGWRWSNDIRPVAGTTSCELDHHGFVLAGRLHVELNDGTSYEIGPGDVYFIPAGHDAWVVGAESWRNLDWSPDNESFGKPKG